MNLFSDLNNYETYLENNPFHHDLGIDLSEYGKINEKVKKSIYQNVDPSNKIPFSPELDDLIRLHYLVRSRKVTTILEFGVGKSTSVFDHALEQNKRQFGDFVAKNLRRSHPFECHSIDNSEDWIENCREKNAFKCVHFHCSACRVTTFNSRICTMYDEIPNICPDFIYLDAPEQFSVLGEVRGISTRDPDRLPMAADILGFEHFLLPGTLIVVDGRTANARFLRANLQREWDYLHLAEYDQHFFELAEEPLGIYNERQILFSQKNAK